MKTTNNTYIVQLCKHNNEDIQVAEFETLEEAKDYVASETSGMVEVCDDDTDQMHGTCHYEIYEDWVISDDGMDMNQPVFESKWYYNE